ncbi:MAG: RNA recognition motif domain-containing protein [Armatimonadota bacterium]|jgi:RNA recognition motif-containing protein
MATKSLYVGNMSYSTTESELRAIFEPHGPIEAIRVITDKGFAFVDLPAENAQGAIDALNGREVGGRPLTVNEARPRPERSRNSGGRSGGYGGGYGGGRSRW